MSGMAYLPGIARKPALAKVQRSKKNVNASMRSREPRALNRRAVREGEDLVSVTNEQVPGRIAQRSVEGHHAAPVRAEESFARLNCDRVPHTHSQQRDDLVCDVRRCDERNVTLGQRF